MMKTHIVQGVLVAVCLLISQHATVVINGHNPPSSSPAIQEYVSVSSKTRNQNILHEQHPQHTSGILLIGFQDEFALTQLRTLSFKVQTTIPQLNIAAVEVTVGQEHVAMAHLLDSPYVTFVEPDYAIYATAPLPPNDPYWYRQWGPSKINAPAIWKTTFGDPDVIVAILDSGIQPDHEDLAYSLWVNDDEIPDNLLDDDDNGKIDDVWGWHFYHIEEQLIYVPREDNHINDDYGHGTHVAGIVGAQVNNHVGIVGVAAGSRLMTVKILDQNGDGWYSDIARGIVYAVDNGADIINLSVGGVPSSQTLQAAVDYAYARDVLVVASAGNTGGAVLYPAACEHVLAVGATAQDDNRWPLSNYGPSIVIAAPGVGIYSTWTSGTYFTITGTSMAAPHVSGVAALLRSLSPSLPVTHLSEIITSTAVNKDTLSLSMWNPYTGWGRVDAAKAMQGLYPHRHYLPIIAHRK